MASGIPCPEHNFVSIDPNDSKLGMHASGNDSKCSAIFDLPIYCEQFKIINLMLKQYKEYLFCLLSKCFDNFNADKL